MMFLRCRLYFNIRLKTVSVSENNVSSRKHYDTILLLNYLIRMASKDYMDGWV
jgi:hypothetical protein